MKTLYLTGALIVVLEGSVVAQEQLPTLTLEQAFQVARERNPRYQRAQWVIDDAQAAVLSGYGSFLPTLQATLGWSGGKSTTFTGEDDFGSAIVESKSRTFTFSSARQGISTGLTVFDGLRNVNRLKAARSDLDAAHASVAIEELTLDAQVARAFYQAIVAARRIQVEKDLLESAHDNLERQQRLFRIASSSQVEVLDAELAVARQELALEQATGEASKRRLEVLELLGILGEVTDFQPVGDLPIAFDPASLDDAEIITRALRANPSIAQREAELAAAQRSLSVARADRLPTISVSASLSRNTSDPGYSALFEFNPRNRNIGFGFDVSIPIFNRFTTSQNISQANHNRSRSEDSLWESQLQVERQVRSALIDLHSQYQALQIQVRSTDLARRQVEIAQEQYRLGSGSMTFIVLQQLIDRLAGEERLLIDRQFRFVDALITLEERVGEPISWPQGIR